jgi:hypothetical protein
MQLFLYVFCYVFEVDDCPVKYNGTALTEDEFTFGISLPSFPDSSEPDFIVGQLETENMLSTYYLYLY